jgi:hypothetical protein
VIVSIASSPGMSPGSSYTIFGIRYGRNSEMKSQKESAKKSTRESASFRFFGPSMGHTASKMCKKALPTIQHSFAISLYLVWFRDSVQIPHEDHWKVATSTWTMHVHTIRNDPPNVFALRRSSEYRNRLTVPTEHQVTSSSSVISRKNSLNMTSRPGRG